MLFPVQAKIFTTITPLNHTLCLLILVRAIVNTVHLSPSPSKIKYTVSKIKYVVDLREKNCGQVEINARWSCMLIKFPLSWP